MKKITALLFAMIFALTVFVPGISEAALAVSSGTYANPAPGGESDAVNVSVTKNPQNPVSADFVVVFNPSSNYESGSVANFSISTQDLDNADDIKSAMTDGGVDSDEPQLRSFHPDEKYKIDPEKFVPDTEESVPMKASVGTEKVFYLLDIMSEYTDTTATNFQCAAVGTHCYVWRPKSSGSYRISNQDAERLGEEFDSNYPEMLSSFGEAHYPSGSNGKMNLLVYNIQDGYGQGGNNSYVGGFFWGGDMLSGTYDGEHTNGQAILHIDTYPLIFSSSSNANISNAFSIITHEYQHLINFSRCNSGSYNPNALYSMETWLNEAMSMAAEEIIYPGSALSERITCWNSYDENYYRGASIYNWDSTLGAYGLSCLFGQYLMVQTGGHEVFKKILDCYDDSYDATPFSAIPEAVDGTPLDGLTLSQINAYFRIAINAYNGAGIYGFHNQSRFSNLHIRPFTGSSVRIFGGGAVSIVPSNGTFDPDDISLGSGLEFYAVKLGAASASQSGLFAYACYDPNDNPGWKSINLEDKTISHVDTLSSNVHSGEYYDGNVYCYTEDDKFLIMNHETRQTTYKNASRKAYDMAYDRSTETMYAIAENDSEKMALYTVNLTTGNLTQKAVISANNLSAYCLGCTTEGQLYIMCSDDGTGVLYSLNKSNGNATRIGSTNRDIEYLQSMAYDHKSKKMYWAQCASTTDTHLYSVNLSNANTTTVLSDCGELCGLYSAYEEEVLDYLTYSVNNGEVTITDCDPTLATNEVIIPETYQGKPITTIAASAFAGCYRITKLTLPSRMMKIYDKAFEGCAQLGIISIPSEVMVIGASVFVGCNKLRSVNVDYANSFYMSESGILYDKDQTTLICCPPKNSSGVYETPSTVTRIESGAMYGCEEITEIYLRNVRQIGDYAFFGCEEVSIVHLPDNVSSIGAYAFSGCKELVSVSIPQQITEIKEGVFSGCASLEQVTFSLKTTKIGDSAFYDCPDLAFVVFPQTLTTIGERAFASCKSLTVVEFPVNVNSFGDKAFENCSSLALARFLGNAPSEFGTAVFDKCHSDFTINFPKNASGWSTPSWRGYKAFPIGGVQIILGDANGDGTVNTGDAVTVLRYSVDQISLTETQLLAADFNTDNNVNTGDAVSILIYCTSM